MTYNINYHTVVLSWSMGGIKYFIVSTFSHWLFLIIIASTWSSSLLLFYLINPCLSSWWPNSESPWPITNALDENLSDEQSKSDSFLSHCLQPNSEWTKVGKETKVNFIWGDGSVK